MAILIQKSVCNERQARLLPLSSYLRIRSFGHRGLKALYEGRTEKRVSPQHVVRLRDILAVLDRSRKPNDMNLPGFRLHPLRGELKGHWAVWVSGNWRVSFRIEAGDVYDVDYLDYH